MTPRVYILLMTLALAGCAAGPASVQTEAVLESGFVRFEFATEGKNSFEIGQGTCEAAKGGTCAIEVATADLQGGWNEIEVPTKRRTGQGQPLVAKFFLGDEAFRRECVTSELGDASDPAALQIELTCTFDDGFGGEMNGVPMVGGKVSVPATSVEVDDAQREAGVSRPLATAELPLVVVNRAGGRWSRPVPVVVPLPLVQLSIVGVRSPWYEDKMPIRLRVEPGAELLVDGKPVRPPRAGKAFQHQLDIEPGDNTLRIEATLEGRSPAVHELSILGRTPDTPLYIDEPASEEVVTSAKEIVVRGWTVPEARLYLAKRPADLHRDGSFELVVPLSEGKNDIEVLAIVDPSPGVRARPATKRSFVVESTPRPEFAAERFLQGAEPEQMAEALAGIADDPWAYVGERVSFVLVIDSVSTSLAGGKCSERIEGEACTFEVTHPVRVGFARRTARACGGESVPAVVELSSCPELHPGDRVSVLGTVRGGLGGRVGQYTVERPRIDGSQVVAAPYLLPETSGGRR